MAEWWSYRLSDFLLFSPRAYWRLFELHNAALWPWPIATLALGAAASAAAILRPRRHGRAIAILVAILWAWVGWSFLWQRYASINWAILHVVPLFALESLLLLAVGGVMGRLPLEPTGPRRPAGILLLALALAYPLATPLFGRPWRAAEFLGMAPDPTAIATLGFLLLARGRPRWLLYPIPASWCLGSGATLFAMGDPQAWLPLAAAILSLAAIALGAGRGRHSGTAGPAAGPSE